MALTGTDRGVGSHNASATSFTLSPSGNFAAGSMAVLCVASDNAGASGAAQTITVTDSIGNTWTRRVTALINPGINAGQEGSIFTTAQDVGPLQTGTVITVTFGAATVAKTWTLQEVVGSVGVPTFVPGGSGTATGGTGTTSPTTGTIPAIAPGRMLIAALFLEAGTTETITGDADTTNGSWSTQQTTEIGTTTSGSNIASQRKIVTARGTQTYNPTLGILGDSCTGWITIHEALPGYEATVRTDSPLGLWRLGEASGLIAYDSIGVAEQDVVNTPTMGVTGLLTGDSNTAMTFAKASLEYTANGIASVAAGSSAGATIEFWCRFDTVTAATIYGAVRWNSSAPVTDTALRYYVASNAWRYFYQDATTARNVYSDTWIPTVGVTYHVAVAHNYTAETVSFYINGTLLSTEDVSANGVPVTHPASFISIARAASDYFDGTLDEVAIYPSVLSGTRILAHYTAGAGASTQTITVPLLDAAPALYAPTVVAIGGPQTLTAPLLDAGPALYAPELIQPGAGADYKTTVLADSPIAFWRLGETSGVLTEDELTGSNEMDLVNTPTLGSTGLLTGDANKSMTFARASTEYAAGGASMPAGSSSGTSLEAWVRFASVTAATRYPILRWFDTSPVAETQLYYDVSNTAWRYLYQDATQLRNCYFDAWTPTTNTTYHIVVTHDYATESVKLYINGSLISTEDVSAFGAAVVHAANGFASIARAGSDYFDGTIDEVAVYNGVLSPTRIQAHYDSGTGVGAPSAQTITVPLLDAAPALYAPTVLPQPVSVTVPLLDAAPALYAPTVLPQPVSVTLGLLTSTSALYAPTILPQPIAVTAPLLTSVATLFAPTVLPQPVLVTIPQLASTAVLFPPTVASASFLQTITLSLLESSGVLSPPTLVQHQFVTLALLDSASALYAPSLTPTVRLDLLDQGAALYAPTIVAAPIVFTIPLLMSASALYPPTVVQLLGRAVWTTPADGVPITAQPVLTFATPAVVPGPMHFQIELDDNAGFSSPTVIDSSASQAGWEYWDDSAWQPIPAGGVDPSYAGNEARYTVQSPLTTGTYYRRVRVGI